MIRKYLLSSVAAVAIVAGSSATSLAADPPVFAPAPVASPAPLDWDGYYVGGHLGVGGAWFDRHPHSGETGDGIATPTPWGVVGGMHVGRNWQMDTFVFGLEADVSATGWDDDEPHPNESSRNASNKVNVLASLRARMGMPFDNSLFYITGGIAYANASYIGVSPGGTYWSGDHNAFGGVAGLGAEWKQNQNFSWRLEGLYYFFDDSEEFGTESPGNRSEFKDALVGRLGATYHFSDMRLKRDVALLSRLENGVGLYRYRYLWSDEVYVGVMAQEAARLVPDAVTRGADGYLRVDYERLGRRLMTWDEWVESAHSDLAMAA